MNEKKNLDRLFQEKFRDFEVAPQEKVWENIKKELTEEKDKPVLIFPLWLKLSGVAAALIAIFLTGSLWFSTENKIPVANQNTIENQPAFQPEKLENEVQMLSSEDEKIKENLSEENKNPTKPALSSTEKNQFSSSVQKDRVVTQRNLSSENTIIKKDNISSENFSSKQNGEVKLHEKSSADRQENENHEIALIENTESTDSPSTENRIKEKSIFEDIAKQENEESVEDIEHHKSFKDKIAVRPNVAPIYYNSMSGGSAVDPKLAGNKVEGEVTMSYGIDVSYAINDRISVRTGVNKVNMAYHTNDIAVVPSSTGMGINAVKNNPQSGNISIVKSGEIKRNPGENYQPNSMFYSRGQVGQQMEYIEVPLEVEFAVLKTRFGINLVGGASTLFLNDDAVRVHSQMGSMDLGRASNLNSMSFTTNFGVGFDYDLTKKLNFNVEPTFKYQINAHSGDVGGFKPYYFGLYSGMSFRF